MASKCLGHILVVSDPPAAPGYLPRVRYLCDFLVRKGYDVKLLTEIYEPLPFKHNYPIHLLRLYSGGTFDWLVKTVWTLLTDWHNRALANRFDDGIQYDVVLCTTFSDFPLGAAQRIAKRLNVPLICDVRDLDEQVEDSRYQYHHRTWWTMPFRKLYRAVHIRRRNKVLRAADAITTVSPWHAEFIKALIANSAAVYTIYNGYDPEQFFPKDEKTDTFRISYIGSLFEWQQPALALVKEVIEELNTSDIILDIHTPKSAPIAHNDLGDAIRQSSMMLVLTNTRTHGMLTTKFYEALGCTKPILCVPSDEGELAKLIHYTNAGIATADKEAIKAFILDKYREWQAQGFTRQDVQHREEFSRETQCQQLEQIIQHYNANRK